MHDFYGYPYMTEWHEDENYTEVYDDWVDYLIPPKIVNRNGSYNNWWILSQTVWDQGPTAGRSYGAGENPYLVVSSLNYDTETQEFQGNHELYIESHIFEKSAHELGGGTYKDFVFTPNGTFIQDVETGKDIVQIIMLQSDTHGIAYEYNLSIFGEPQYITSYWK